MTREVPWPRILAEGVAIVVSILLAFGIQAWWEGRQDAERVGRYLVALHGEIDSTRDELLGDMARRDTRIETWLSILDAISARRSLPSDTISAWLTTLWGSARTSTESAVYDDLTTSGSLDLIRSDELRYALLRYGRERDRLVTFEDRQQDGWDTGLRPHLLAYTDALAHVPRRGLSLPPPTFDDGLQALLADRTFHNLLLDRIQLARLINGTARGVMEEMDELQALIDEYVD